MNQSTPLSPNLNLRLLTAQDVADQLHVSLRTVRRLTSSGALLTIRIGRSVRVTEAVLRAFIEASAR